MVKVLVACEFSGVVRDAFLAEGHDAISCDLLPTEREGPHYQGDVKDILYDDWDLLIAHPPCTYLAVSGARWMINNPERQQKQKEALDFVRLLLDAPVPHIALENPISVISTRVRKPNQILQPWRFGHGETKAICIWWKNLERLISTDIVSGREARVHKEPPSKDRWKNRSRFFTGIAKAMAQQWGALCSNSPS